MSSESSTRVQWRMRLAAWCTGLVAVAFIQTPGRIATDTKLDLTIDPVGFLGRSLQLWDPAGAFGQVQNQAYGYLFPMGPFFALGRLVELDPWVVQRLWWGLLLVVAFLGVVKLTGVLGIGTGWTRIAAGLAFALSPRMLSVIGPSSIEVWPSAVAPWVLVPLVIGLQRGSTRRAAALSAVAVACIGGVNAAATFAVVPLAALWLLAAPRGPRRRSLMTWWPPFVLMGTLWWLLPLFLLGRYSPPFLDYIESASNTTFAATALDALRGTSNWVPYVDPDSVAGNDLITQPLLLANLTVLLCLGVLGLARADLPHRRFLLGGLLVGMTLVTLGHTGSVQGLGAGSVQSLLDGALAPLRNTHKFDVVVRLPLVLAACHAVTVLTRRRAAGTSGARRLDPTAVGVAFLALVALAGSTVPAWTASVANRQSFSEVPSYWTQASSWLEQNAQGRTVLTPATGFGDYLWGKTADEPLQPLLSSPWAVRNLIPLTPGGTIGMLDALSARFATGRGSEGLATYLRRAGIGTLVVRHDLDRNQDIVPPELVRATLMSTPGVRRVASFGPEVGGGPTLRNEKGDEVFVDQGWQTPRPALEVFELEGVGTPTSVTRQTAAGTPVLVGDADSLLALDDAGVTDGSVVMAKDADRSQAYGSTVLTDGNRRQESSFGTVNHQRSASLTEQERYGSSRRVHRYDEEALRRWTTTPELRGARSISSSSSQAAVGAAPFIDQAAQTWAAFDGDPRTGWEPSRSRAGSRAWVRLELQGRVDAGTATIRLGLAEGESQTVRVSTESGPRTVRVQGPAPVTVQVGRVRAVTVSGLSTVARPLVVKDVTLSRVEVTRPLVLPTLPEAWAAPRTVLLQAGPGYDDGCTTFDGDLRCSDAYYAEGDSGRTLDRELTLPAASTYTADLRAVATGGPALDSLLQTGRLATVAASSQRTGAPQNGPLSAVDGRAGTGWVAAADDLVPTLTLQWLRERPVSRLTLRTDDLLAASVPTRVRLRFSDGSSTEAPVEDGVVRFPRVSTSSVRVQVIASTSRFSVDFSGGIETLPVGVSEVSVAGVDAYPVVLDTRVRRWACGTGPTVTVDGVPRRSSLVASPRQLADGDTVSASLCASSPVQLDAGVRRVTVTSTEAVRPVDVRLTSTTISAADPATPRATVVVTTHNTNPGWSGEQDGRTLAPVVLNGWQQGWTDTARSVTGRFGESFVPGTTYRVALGTGAMLALALLIVVLLPSASSGPPAAGGPRRGAAVLLAVAGAAAGLVIGGPAGLGAAVVGGALPFLARGRRDVATPWVAVAAVGVAGVVSVLRPWAGSSSWSGQLALPQLLVLLALGCLAAADLRPKPFLSRRKGSSTKR